MLSKLPQKYRDVIETIRAFDWLIGFLIFIGVYIVEPLSPVLTVEYTSLPYLIDHSTTTNSTTPAQHNPQTIDLDFYEIRLQNHTNATIKDIELVVNGVRSIHNIGLDSSSARVRNASRTLVSTVTLDDDRMLFSELREIPPQTQITIQLIGNTYPLFFESRIKVSAAPDNIRVNPTRNVSGIIVLLDRHLGTISIIIILGLLYLGIRRLTTQYGTQT